MDLEEIVPNTHLRLARHLKGWTQSDLAAALGTSFETVSRWERGITLPGPYFRVRLCTILGQTAQELGLSINTDDMTAPSSLLSVFLASAHADAENEMVASIKTGLQVQGIALWSNRLIKRQQEDNPKKALREIISGVHLVLLIASPHTRSSRNVNAALRLANLYQRHICLLWVEGEHLQDCIPAGRNEFIHTIDVRQGCHQLALAEIIAILERIESTARETLELTPVARTTGMSSSQTQSRCPYEELHTLLLNHANMFTHDQRIDELLALLKALLAEQGTQCSC